MMFRSALNRIAAHSETTVMVGDRMDTDVVAGIEAGLETILVLTGSTTEPISPATRSGRASCCRPSPRPSTSSEPRAQSRLDWM